MIYNKMEVFKIKNYNVEISKENESTVAIINESYLSIPNTETAILAAIKAYEIFTYEKLTEEEISVVFFENNFYSGAV